MGRLAGPGHIIYDAARVHVTVRSIEARRAAPRADDDRVQQYAQLLAQAALNLGPITFTFRGLTASRSGVMAQGWPEVTGLREMRNVLHRELEEHSLLSGPEYVRVRTTAHASLAVFTTCLADPAGLVVFIERNRGTDFGACTMDSLDLVFYERGPTSVSLRSLASVALVPRG